MKESESSSLLPGAEAPGLTALVVYLRPARREHLLPLLAGLGLFVMETTGIEGKDFACARAVADIVVVLGDGSAEELALIERLAGQGVPLMASVAGNGGCSAEEYQAAGVAALVLEQEGMGAFGAAIGLVARQARGRRDLATALQ